MEEPGSLLLSALVKTKASVIWSQKLILRSELPGGGHVSRMVGLNI